MAKRPLSATGLTAIQVSTPEEIRAATFIDEATPVGDGTKTVS